MTNDVLFAVTKYLYTIINKRLAEYAVIPSTTGDGHSLSSQVFMANSE